MGFAEEEEEDTEEGERVTEEDIMGVGSVHTLHLHLTANPYAIASFFNNGKENEVRTLNFNETIVYPENVTKTGYTFNGWDKIIPKVPSYSLVITGRRIGKPPEYVEIVLEKKVTSKKEAEETIKEYTDETFINESLEADPDKGETKAIIRFIDVHKSEAFVRSVNENKDLEVNLIKRANMVVNGGSFSFIFHSLSFYTLASL